MLQEEQVTEEGGDRSGGMRRKDGRTGVPELTTITGSHSRANTDAAAVNVRSSSTGLIAAENMLFALTTLLLH